MTIPDEKYVPTSRYLAAVFFALVISTSTALAQYNPDSFSAMKWRLVGPHRAGRVTAVAGISGQPATYYFGTPGGGLWKTTDGGRVWQQIFDDVHVPSIGAVALAPSNPNIIYVGTGEQLEGNGVYKSTDAGASWINVGLKDVHHISSIIIDPRDPNIVLAGTYDYFSTGPQRGIFKTTDGGKTWNKVLFKDDKTGIVDLCAAPDDARAIYAASYTFQFDPNNRRGIGSESQIFKSTDAGATWQQVNQTGLPGNPRGRIGVAVAPGTSGKRVYAIMNQGFFRSDDGGVSWRQSTKDPRVLGSGYFSRTYADPKNPDVVYVMQTATYRSADGGKTFAAWKGEPSGEDDHVLWIDPGDSQRIFMGTDQGAVITLNGGRTWTEWFNQPTGEMYHVTTDNQFPYRLYAAQQDSGSVAVLSRSDFGMITYRDWFSTGAFESGRIAPDPLNPNVVFSVGWYGSVLRLDRTTGQLATVFAPGAKYRYTWETPLVRSPQDPKTMYLGTQFAMRTTDNGESWAEISPDLTTTSPSQKAVGVIQVIAASAAQAGEIWAGTSTGLVQLTRDNGSTWNNVTPVELPPNSSITLIEASPNDGDIAYVVAAGRNDLHPYIVRTRDAGKTWQQIVTGLASNASARVVREDPRRKGLLYGGTENGAYVSFDAGDNWQSLQLNLPTVSVRDLHVHGDDLVAATYGRALWILDDISPLRQISSEVANANAHLFKPANAVRTRWDNHPDTPLPNETAHGDNPPDGAIIYYYLRSAPKNISLEIRDDHGNVVRKFSDKAPPRDPRPKNVPEHWFEPAEALTTHAGLNRFVWNLQWPHPDTLAYSFRGSPLDYIEYTMPDHAVSGNTPVNQPPGPFVISGPYEVILTVDGKTYRQTLAVGLDPRVKTSASDLQAQVDLARIIDSWMNISFRAYNEIAALRVALTDRQTKLATVTAAKEAADSTAALSVLIVAGNQVLSEIDEGTSTEPGFGSVNRDLARYVTMIQSGDARPAKSAAESATLACKALKNDLERWRQINEVKLPELNKALQQSKLAPLPSVAVDKEPTCPN
jgi:photosystem II stability/assembly factor-like uncharacterized protein